MPWAETVRGGVDSFSWAKGGQTLKFSLVVKYIEISVNEGIK